MVGIGAPRSNEFWLVHLPVPFCCASSRMTSTSGWPVSLSMCRNACAVISIKYERSSASFHSEKMSAISAADRPPPRLQQVVDLGDELHVAVLDPVVHHLDVVPGPARAHVGDARLAVVGLCGDGAEDGGERVPRRARAARHDRWSVKRAFLAARTRRRPRSGSRRRRARPIADRCRRRRSCRRQSGCRPLRDAA